MRSSLTALAVLLLASTARGQTTVDDYYDLRFHEQLGSTGTVEGHYLRGVGSLVRSQAQANLIDAQALEQLQEARRRYLQYRLEATEAYFQNRLANQQYRQSLEPRPTTEQIFRLAEVRAPQPLSAGELDPLSGEINWPVVLRDRRFAAYRSQFEELFRIWAGRSGRLSFAEYQAIRDLTEETLETMRQHVEEYPQQEYGAAISFMRSLAYMPQRVERQRDFAMQQRDGS